MRSKRNVTINIAGAVLAPVIVVVAMIVLERSFEDAAPWYGTSAPLWIATAVGCVFVARQIRWYAILVAPPYFWVMFHALEYFGLMFVGLVYHDYL